MQSCVLWECRIKGFGRTGYCGVNDVFRNRVMLGFCGGLGLEKVLAEYHNWHSKEQSRSPEAVRSTQAGRLLSGGGWDLFTAGYHSHC